MELLLQRSFTYSHLCTKAALTLQVHDIEDLCRFGKSVRGCPYFAARHYAGHLPTRAVPPLKVALKCRRSHATSIEPHEVVQAPEPKTGTSFIGRTTACLLGALCHFAKQNVLYLQLLTTAFRFWKAASRHSRKRVPGGS